MRKTAVATVTALSLMAAPAFAQESEEPKGQTTSPAKFCEGKSKKKVAGTKGQTEFAGCVSGVKGHNAEAAKNEQREEQGKPARKLNPARFCKSVVVNGLPLSKKPAAEGQKSPYAACVSGYMKAKKQAAAPMA
jgi:hypothetical protein